MIQNFVIFLMGNAIPSYAVKQNGRSNAFMKKHNERICLRLTHTQTQAMLVRMCLICCFVSFAICALWLIVN